MRILLWDVHGGYTDSLVCGDHSYLFPCDPAPLAGGRLRSSGLARLGPAAPRQAVEASRDQLRDEPPDVVLLQRSEEIQGCAELLGRTPGPDIPAIFLEHNTPKADVPLTKHPLADTPGWLIVHVTHFNDLFWDCGDAPTTVIEHGVPDPGRRYSGEQESLAFVVNEPVRRWRVTGTDLLPRFGAYRIDAFGIDADLLPDRLGETCPRLRFSGNLSTPDLLAELAQRRIYLHLNRWTSLGLSLIQAMLLGLPIVAVDATEASRAVPVDAGILSTDVSELVRAVDRLLHDVDEATELGRRGRAAALTRYGLDRFLADWDAAFGRVA